MGTTHHCPEHLDSIIFVDFPYISLCSIGFERSRNTTISLWSVGEFYPKWKLLQCARSAEVRNRNDASKYERYLLLIAPPPVRKGYINIHIVFCIAFGVSLSLKCIDVNYTTDGASFSGSRFQKKLKCSGREAVLFAMYTAQDGDHCLEQIDISCLDLGIMFTF